MAPNVAFASPAPSSAFDGIDTVQFLFAEPVFGFDTSDLLLTRGGLEIPLSAAQTLTTGDNQTFTLGNLLSLNTTPGHYELSLLAQDSGIQDAAANPLPLGTFKNWRVLLRVDADQDDFVGGRDFVIWQRNLGLSSGAQPTDGDSDGDGDVDADDLEDWKQGYGTLLAPTPVVSDFNASGSTSFASLQTAHASFLGSAEQSITFDGLSGVISPTQFSASHGVTFSNLGQIGADAEGSTSIESLDGYDGSYQADGDTVYATYPNHILPLTLDFASPVARVGSFVGIGKEGSVDTLTVTALDSTGAILTTQTVPTQPFANGQNREGFWAVGTDVAAISRVTIQNDSSLNFANALILDTLEWSTTPIVSTTAALPTTTAPSQSASPGQGSAGDPPMQQTPVIIAQDNAEPDSRMDPQLMLWSDRQAIASRWLFAPTVRRTVRPALGVEEQESLFARSVEELLPRSGRLSKAFRRLADSAAASTTWEQAVEALVTMADGKLEREFRWR